MPDYRAIEKEIAAHSAIIDELVDGFLLHYADEKEKLAPKAEKQFAKYRHIVQDLPESWKNMAMGQYIAHRIFRKGGLIHRYKDHSAIRDLSREKRNFIEHQVQRPWRFCFSRILESPEENFFRTENVLTGEEMLLHSEGVRKELERGAVPLLFHLLLDNGSCWTSYGPIAAFRSFAPSDILFYAHMLYTDHWFESWEELDDAVQADPIPFMLLIHGAETPVQTSEGYQMRVNRAEYEYIGFDPKLPEGVFIHDEAEGVHRYRLEEWEKPPHFGAVYYDSKEELLLINACTNECFDALTKELRRVGLDVDDEPDHNFGFSMRITAEKILKKDFSLKGYEDLFEEEASPAAQEEIDKLNEVMAELIPEINQGKRPDVDKRAREAGLDPNTLKELVDHLFHKLGKG